MKKYFISLLIVTLLIFSACTGKKDDQEANNPEENSPKQEDVQNNEENEAETENKQEKEEVQASKINQFPEASQGKFTDLSIKFNDTREEVAKKLGDPDEITTWQGSDLYIFGNIGIYIDPSEEKVTGLTAGEGYRTYGIQIGMSSDEIKEILGKPDYEGESYESGADVLEYVAGDYLVEIVLHPETKLSAGITLYSYK